MLHRIIEVKLKTWEISQLHQLLSDKEGEWRWIHNNLLATEEIMKLNNPSNWTEQAKDCAVLVVFQGKVSWEEQDCSASQLQYVATICQKKTESETFLNLRKILSSVESDLFLYIVYIYLLIVYHILASAFFS